MSSGGSKRLVLNSFRILRDVLPQVLMDLASESPEEWDEWNLLDSQGNPDLYPTIRDTNHRIVVTDRIQREYFGEARNVGLPEEFFLRIIQHLEAQGMIIRPRVPGGRPALQHVPQYHRALLEDSILAGVDYFITERNVWLDRADRIRNTHGISIVTPGGFIRREGIS